MSLTDAVARRSKIPSILSTRTERVASKYLESFVFGSSSPRQQERFAIHEESIENQHLHPSASSPPAYEINGNHTLRSKWRSKLLRARCVSSYICAIIVFITLVTLTLAVTIPLTLCQRFTPSELEDSKLGLISNFTTSNSTTTGVAITTGLTALVDNYTVV